MTLPVSTSDIIRRWLAGDSIAKIAEDVGCCAATVRYRMRTRDICLGRAKIDALTIERIHGLHAKGVSSRSIAHELKISQRTVLRHTAMKDYTGTLTELRDNLQRVFDQGKGGDPNKLARYIDALNAILR